MAESFYAASRLVGWMDIVIGDPICRAYKNNSANNSTDGNSIKIYPNPCKEIVNISKNENYNYKILDVTGRLIVKGIIQDKKIITTSLKSGIYFVTLFNNNKTETKKLVKN